MVTRALIGKRLVRTIEESTLVGRIVEAEAYRGSEDAASHAHRGRTGRNAPMFGPPGHTYVYFIYGMHWMLNIAAHVSREPGAVLIRALQPEEELDKMRAYRNQQRDRNLTNGPAKLAQAMAIDDSMNDLDLCTSLELYVTEGELRENENVICGPRVRVPGGERAQRQPWRFWIADNPWVSS